MSFSKITIIGLGLMGGSLACALKKSGRVGEVFGVDLDEKALDYAVREGIIDNGSKEIEEGVNHSEVVVIATYVGIIPQVAMSVASIASKGTIITDVGSVKGKIVKEIEDRLPSHLHFIGGHPIAGTERSGVWASDLRLFKGTRCILTPTLKTQPEALSKVKSLWESVGARIFSMDAETHDRVFSFVSHLPHVVAYALVNSVASQRERDNMLDFAGGGLRDYTRIGASSPDMWSDIFLMNRENVLGSIREFKKALEKIEELIAKEDLRKLKEELDKAVRIKRNMDK
ncbi:MAG: prephenate dehydrogenase [Deltaproteobacteria bacterium]|nr:prephenate dehydrogenase [Deltaproteobacteria bacterium]